MPNNQQYIEEIIEVAVQGGFVWNSNFLPNTFEFKVFTLEPSFWQAIGKVKGWIDEEGNSVAKYYRNDAKKTKYDLWLWNWHSFIDKIAEKDLDHAIEWLYKLIKE